MRFSDLSPARQGLVRLAQLMNYGQMVGLSVRNGDPVLDPAPAVLLDIKLNGDAARREIGLVDFNLPVEIKTLMAQFDEIQNGEIEAVHVQAGLPRRIIVRAQMKEAVR